MTSAMWWRDPAVQSAPYLGRTPAGDVLQVLLRRRNDDACPARIRPLHVLHVPAQPGVAPRLEHLQHQHLQLQSLTFASMMPHISIRSFSSSGPLQMTRHRSTVDDMFHVMQHQSSCQAWRQGDTCEVELAPSEVPATQCPSFSMTAGAPVAQPSRRPVQEIIWSVLWMVRSCIQM
jgi:hypothetical protein